MLIILQIVVFKTSIMCASKFNHVLRWTENGVLKVQKYLAAAISIPPNVTTKLLCK